MKRKITPQSSKPRTLTEIAVLASVSIPIVPLEDGDEQQ